MHTSPDYITKEPELWVIHNSDFSGEAFVGWTIKGADKEFTYQWRVPNGKDLLTGNLIGTPLEDNTAAPVPTWVVARAVATALRHQLLRQIVGYVEML